MRAVAYAQLFREPSGVAGMRLPPSDKFVGPDRPAPYEPLRCPASTGEQTVVMPLANGASRQVTVNRSARRKR